MAPQRNNDKHSGHTGTIPKSKVRNNCNVPQEAVTPTRRDMTSNLVSTSLDWVPVSEYNTRSNHNQSRKPANNTSDHELTDLDNAASFESGFGRFVPVRPQPRALPLNVSEGLNVDHIDDGAGASLSAYSLHPYGHTMQNGLTPQTNHSNHANHVNHAAAAVMIVNPTTPNAVPGNMSQPFNAPVAQNRNNLTRNLNPARNNFEGSTSSVHSGINNTTPPVSSSRTGTKTVNLINNMYDSGQGSSHSSHNLNENNHVHRESARALGEAIVAACPDAAAVERRLGQIREYIRVTSSLVDTMRNSEDEAYIEHTKEEYDELVQMVMKLKESELKLEVLLVEKGPDNIEVPAEEVIEPEATTEEIAIETQPPADISVAPDVIATSKPNISENANVNNALKKVLNIENEQLNKTLHKGEEIVTKIVVEESPLRNEQKEVMISPLVVIEKNSQFAASSEVEIQEMESTPLTDIETDLQDRRLKDILRQNILSCVEKVALIEELKSKSSMSNGSETQDVVVRPASAQSNGSAYSENELWQNEIKSKMELSQQRLMALKQQQKRLIKYQADAKQQLDEMNRARQEEELNASTSHDNLAGMQNRMYAANQIGVATTLPHSTESIHGQPNIAISHAANNIDESRSHDGRYSYREANIASSEDAAGGGRDSDPEDDDAPLGERGRQLTMKLRELQLKKQHMEGLVTEFQKLQMAARLDSSRNTYSSSGEESVEEDNSRKCIKSSSSSNIKNEDPFKLMEIKAIKTALQKTKDLMRSVENYEAEQLSGSNTVRDEDTFQMPSHPNIHDNKSEDSGGGWSRDGSVCRVRNSLPRRHKFTNEQHEQQQSHEANLASLQDLAQELRRETEKIMGERARLKDMASHKEFSRKQKKVNEEVRPSTSGAGGHASARAPPRPAPRAPGPAERRQMELRNMLAEKQKELEALLNKEKVISTGPEVQIADSREASIVNQSYNSDQEEPDSRSEHVLLESQTIRDHENYRGDGDSAMGGRSLNTLPSHLGSVYASDSDSASRTKSNQRSRGRRRHPQERQPEENVNVTQTNIVNPSHSARHEPRVETPNVNMVPPSVPNGETPNIMPYPHQAQPPCWANNKTNQDMRTNQFTQNSHSQTMDRLLGTPQMPYPPSMPFNMMMPYGVVGGCGCGCGVWGAWCWQQLVLQQQEMRQLRDQLHLLEERWRAETASHTLNNQVPPGNRANNYWDNFRSYSRQNLLSASSKTNADGHLGVVPSHNHHPLVERSHNTLHPSASSTPPSNTPKRNINAATSSQNAPIMQPIQTVNNTDEPTNRHGRRNVAYERSLSFSSAPDVLNLNQNTEAEGAAAASAQPRSADDSATNVNLNRQDDTFRNLNITNPIPEIIQSHANNLNTTPTLNTKKKSSSKLPAKNSTNRRNFALDYSQTSNVNIASTTETPNPNLASTSRESHDKATSKLFDLLRENVYTEVTALIGVNESHPDFLIQLFRELQLISSEPLRQKVLQSIRNLLAQYPSIMECHTTENGSQEENSEAVTTTTNESHSYPENSIVQNGSNSNMHIDNNIVRFLFVKSEETCTPEVLEALASVILKNAGESNSPSNRKLIFDMIAKYEGMRICDVSGDILEFLPHLLSIISDGDGSLPHASELSESSILQDVAGSLNLYSSSDTQLHQMSSCPYDMWPGHVHMEMDNGDMNETATSRSGQDGKVDLINCSEMHNGDLAEADQTCRGEAEGGASANEEPISNAEALPDVVDTDEVTPTEAEAEWLGLDRVPTRLHMEDSSERQKD